VPAESSSFDIACAFSVFTHLLHHETFAYMQDIRRALKLGGKLVFSFLEFGEDNHWAIFDHTIQVQRDNTTPHLNMFIERGAIEVWARRGGWEIDRYIGGMEAVGDAGPLGQSTVIMTKV
jgi:Methyltransferase domain